MFARVASPDAGRKIDRDLNYRRASAHSELK